MPGRTLFILLALPALVLIGCNTSVPAPDESHADIVNRSGEVLHMSAQDVYVIQDRTENGTRYSPSNLPGEFEQHRLRVIFSGRVGEIPPNVRFLGVPLELTDIRMDTR